MTASRNRGRRDQAGLPPADQRGSIDADRPSGDTGRYEFAGHDATMAADRHRLSLFATLATITYECNDACPARSQTGHLKVATGGRVTSSGLTRAVALPSLDRAAHRAALGGSGWRAAPAGPACGQHLAERGRE